MVLANPTLMSTFILHVQGRVVMDPLTDLELELVFGVLSPQQNALQDGSKLLLQHCTGHAHGTDLHKKRQGISRPLFNRDQGRQRA